MKMIIRANAGAGSNYMIWYTPVSKCWFATFEVSRQFSSSIICSSNYEISLINDIRWSFNHDRDNIFSWSWHRNL